MWQNVCVCLVSYKVCTHAHRTRVVGGLDTPASNFYLTLTISGLIAGTAGGGARSPLGSSTLPGSPASWGSTTSRWTGESTLSGVQRLRLCPRNFHLTLVSQVLKGHDDHVITCLQFSGNRIVSGSDDNTLKVTIKLTQTPQNRSEQLFSSFYNLISGVVCYDG